MAVRIVQLGTPRRRGEGIRLGTVRRPPRGVPKSQHAAQDWYDVWLPALAPSARLLRTASFGDDDREWTRFARRYRAEMNKGDASRLLDLLATMSQATNFSVGCYCDDERRCHRTVLRELLAERGARMA